MSGVPGAAAGCVLLGSGGVIDSAGATIAAQGTSGNGAATLTLSGSSSSTSTETIPLDCIGGVPPTSPATVANTVITAIQLNGLTTTGS